MVYGIVASVFGVGLFFGMSILLEVGRRNGIRRSAEDPEGAPAWLHILCFSFVIAVNNTLLDIEYPRLGFIRVDAFDQALVELRESME